MPVDLRHAVRRARVEARGLTLGDFGHLAEHLARARLVEADLRVDLPDCLEEPRHAQGGELTGQDRLVPGRRDERLRGEVVDLARPHRAERLGERVLVEEIALHDLDVIDKVRDPLHRHRARAPRHPVDRVALVQEELGQV